MNARMSAGPPVRNRLLAFYDRNRRIVRVAGHTLAWIIFYFVFINGTYGRVFNDNLRVTNTASIVEFIKTTLLFYFIGYYVLPKFLYKRNYMGLFIISSVVFFVVYQVDYYLFYYLESISNDVDTDGKETYAKKVFTMLQEAGWLGCFTNLRVCNWNLLYGFGLPILILIIKVFRDIINYQKRLVLAERDKFALELAFLKAQINPHFLFNTLNSVYARIFDTDEQAANLVLQLSELMRYNLYETDQAKITLDKELAYLQNYLDLERNRLADQNVLIDYQQQGDPSAYQIAPLLLITFVENAFKHGVKGSTTPAYVQVTADIREEGLRFTVENSVPPKRSAVERAPKSGGVGLGNVRRRLEALYTGRYTLSVTATDDTYVVCLTIQLETTTAA